MTWRVRRRDRAGWERESAENGFGFGSIRSWSVSVRGRIANDVELSRAVRNVAVV
jgi:hypothetical protein